MSWWPPAPCRVIFSRGRERQLHEIARLLAVFPSLGCALAKARRRSSARTEPSPWCVFAFGRRNQGGREEAEAGALRPAPGMHRPANKAFSGGGQLARLKWGRYAQGPSLTRRLFPVVSTLANLVVLRSCERSTRPSVIGIDPDDRRSERGTCGSKWGFRAPRTIQRRSHSRSQRKQ
jgi:hypothetical protein